MPAIKMRSPPDLPANTVAEAKILLNKAKFTQEGLLGMNANKEAVTAIKYAALLHAVEKHELQEESLKIVYDCEAIEAIKASKTDTHTEVYPDCLSIKLLASMNINKIKLWKTKATYFI